MLRLWSNCVKVRPKLAQPSSKVSLIVSTSSVDRLQPSNDAVKGGKRFIESFVHMLVRSGRSSSRVGFQFIEEIGTMNASLHRHLKKKKERQECPAEGP